MTGINTKFEDFDRVMSDRQKYIIKSKFTHDIAGSVTWIDTDSMWLYKVVAPGLANLEIYFEDYDKGQSEDIVNIYAHTDYGYVNIGKIDLRWIIFEKGE